MLQRDLIVGPAIMGWATAMNEVSCEKRAFWPPRYVTVGGDRPRSGDMNRSESRRAFLATGIGAALISTIP